MTFFEVYSVCLKTGTMKRKLVKTIRMELQRTRRRVYGIYEEVHLWSYIY
jgi:uncharacterized metal-binding protein